MSELQSRLSRSLSQLRAEDLYRSRRIIAGAHGAEIEVDGQRCLNFCSNDYLGLAADPRVAEAAAVALERVGTGSSASPLICGYNDEHRLLEEALAEFTGYERVLLFTSGWAANCGVLKALLGKNDILIADELNHASLIDGGRLSGARYVRVAHADTDAFALASKQTTTGIRLIATDSVFSMDGDLAPLAELSRLDASLMVDDAHGFGVLGANGRGAAEQLGVRPDIYVATLGKSLGAAGAFVAGSADLIEYLIQRARSWVFSTAPPPAIAAAARAALQIVRDEPERRAALQQNIRQLIRGAAELEIPLGLPDLVGQKMIAPIIPIVIGESARTMSVSKALLERGVWVAGVRPPTVPQGTSRLRITLSAAHASDQIEILLSALDAAGLGSGRELAA